MSRRVALVFALWALCACDPMGRPDAGDPDRPVCANATRAQARAAADPLVWRGVVTAPQPAPRASLLDHIISPAHAMALPGESPVAGASVVASYGDARVEATTDAQGRYCLRVEAGWGAGWSLAATTPAGEALRGLPDLPARADVSVQTEAMQRALDEAGLDPRALTPAQRLNLHTLADSALGLLNPTPLAAASQVAPAVEAARVALGRDGRWREALARLKPGG